MNRNHTTLMKTVCIPVMALLLITSGCGTGAGDDATSPAPSPSSMTGSSVSTDAPENTESHKTKNRTDADVEKEGIKALTEAAANETVLIPYDGIWLDTTQHKTWTDKAGKEKYTHDVSGARVTEGEYRINLVCSGTGRVTVKYSMGDGERGTEKFTCLPNAVVVNTIPVSIGKDAIGFGITVDPSDNTVAYVGYNVTKNK